MPKFTIESVNLMGFLASAVMPGEKVDVIECCSLNSESASFHVFMLQIANTFFPTTKLRLEQINRLLVVLHKNKVADIYVNDVKEQLTVQPKGDFQFKEGEAVFIKDIENIQSVTFPEVEIREDDAVIYFCRVNYRFGLHFDFTRTMNLEHLAQRLGLLKNDLMLTNLLTIVQAEMSDITTPFNALIFTEGQTDWQHLKKAGNELRIDLGLKFDELLNTRGDTQLFTLCENLARVPHSKKVICIFDKDNHKVITDLEKMNKLGRNYQSWGNNVFSFLLPVPSHRQKYKKISIELFYKDEELKRTDSSGRRLYFDNELMKEILPGNRMRMIAIEPELDEELEFNKKIESGLVDRIYDKNGNKVALSKSVFASYVLNGEKNFDNFDLSEFREIFGILAEIIMEEGIPPMIYRVKG